MKTNNRKTYGFRGFTKPVYLMTLFALAAIAIVGFSQLTNSSGAVSARESNNRATPEMLAYALNMKSAAGFTVFAGNGITNRSSRVDGTIGVAGNDAQIIGFDRTNVRGLDENADRFDTARTQADLSETFYLINQLPCTEVNESQLGGKSFGPGVYCLSSASLAGQMVLDGGNDKASIFIFRIAGSFNTKDGSSVSLINDAQASNAYFVAGDSANIGGGNDFRGSVMAKNGVNVGSGTTVAGRTLSSDGIVSLESATVALQTGTIQICKNLDTTNGAPVQDISNRIFFFTIDGFNDSTNPIRVPVNGCSPPIAVAAGTRTITELNNGETLDGGTFTGNFQLLRVETITARSPSTLGVVNLSARTATVNVVMDDPNAAPGANDISLRFINRFAITGFVEICKNATSIPNSASPDPDVTGMFIFTIEGLFTQNQQNASGTFTRVLQQIPVAVGRCSGPMAVTINNPVPTNTTPLTSTVRVTELGRTDIGVSLESVDVLPANREVGQEVLGFGVNASGNIFTNPGGGFDTVIVFEGATPANEVLLNFNNRSNGGLIKVCKIASTGVPVNTPFTFSVSGLTQTGPGPNNFGNVTRTVTVLAGPASNIGSDGLGGFCQFVPVAEGSLTLQRFVIGTPVTVTETGPLTIGGNQVRTSRIRASTGQVLGADLTPTNTRVSVATVIARSEVVALEFTNFVFRPTLLKVCKIAGAGIVQGTPFVFDVSVTNPQGAGGNLFPTNTTSVTVEAGPAATSGTCTFVNSSSFIGGSLNAGSTITITERAVANTAVSSIASVTSPTSTTNGFSGNNATRTATLTGLNGLRTDVTVNTVTFTNIGTVADPTSQTQFDFDGDGKADMSTFRPSNGTWYILGSQIGSTGVAFGLGTDRLVPADYDGDGKTDIAVYRAGYWYINGSRSGFSSAIFGDGNDIPVPGDFDGDGRADIAVYRPSNGTWYIMGSRDGFRAEAFGTSTDKPVVADYDGDGRADIAVFRSSNGTWYINRSSAGVLGVAFGANGDQPVPADYDGDGKADIAVTRISNGTTFWYLQNSSTGFRSVAFGNATDRPVPADYNGDGKADIAVYRNGTWFIFGSSDNFSSFDFGSSTDTPVPSSLLQ